MNFKRTLVSTAVASSLALAAGAASAVNLSETGTGQVFFFPYYTTQDAASGSYDTYIHLINTTSAPKAVKIRFREGRASKEVLDFNIYLSGNDMWTGSVTVTDAVNGVRGAKITTGDTTCTVPAIPVAGEPFRNYLYTNTGLSLLGDQRDGGAEDLERTREGYLEVIEMGVPIAAALKSGADFVDSITHDQTVVPVPTPPGCADVVASWKRSNSTTTDAWFDSHTVLTAPTGGLIAAGEVINVTNGSSFGMEPTAIDNWAITHNHAYPGTENPAITTGDEVSVVYAGTSVVSSDWGAVARNGADSVSALLMRSAVINEFTVNPKVNSMTDWVVTFPTKHFYVPTDGSPAVRPFDTAWDTDAGESCEPVQMNYFNREETPFTQTTSTSVDFSPQLPSDKPGYPTLCHEANVITFVPSDADELTYKGLLGSKLQRSLKLKNTTDDTKTYFKTGWMRLSLTEISDAESRTTMDVAAPVSATYAGLPVIGFAVIGKYAPAGNAGNYGTEKLHKFTRTITLAP